jgi:hypothetical protein
VGFGVTGTRTQATGQVIMKRLRWSLAVVLVPAILGAAGLLVAHAAPPAPARHPASTLAQTPTPASTHPASAHPASTHPASGKRRASHAPRHTARSRRTGPWAVITTYYRDVTARRYARAWALISPGLGTGQTYAQFVAGYACTRAERPAKLRRSGHQVSFQLTVIDSCTGAARHYTGTDTVRGGKIVAVHITRTS